MRGIHSIDWNYILVFSIFFFYVVATHIHNNLTGVICSAESKLKRILSKSLKTLGGHTESRNVRDWIFGVMCYAKIFSLLSDIGLGGGSYERVVSMALLSVSKQAPMR